MQGGLTQINPPLTIDGIYRSDWERFSPVFALQHNFSSDGRPALNEIRTFSTKAELQNREWISLFEIRVLAIRPSSQGVCEGGNMPT